MKTRSERDKEQDKRDDVIEANKLYDQALTLFDSEKYEDCIDALHGYLEYEIKEEEQAEAYFLIGYALSKMKHYKEALQYSYKAYEVDPNILQYIYSVGYTYHDLKFYNEAIEYYDEYLEIEQDNPDIEEIADIYYNKASALLDNFKYKEALTAYNKSIELNNTQPYAHNNKASLLRKMGRYIDSLPMYDIDLQSRSSTHSFTGKGISLSALGRYNPALKSYNTSIKLDHTYIDTYHEKANMFLKVGKYAPAVKTYKNAIAHNPDKIELYLNKAQVSITKLLNNFHPSLIDDTVAHIDQIAQTINKNFEYGHAGSQHALQTLANYKKDLNFLYDKGHKVINTNNDFYTVNNDQIYIINKVEKLMNLIVKAPQQVAFRGQNCLHWDLQPSFYRDDNQENFANHLENFKFHSKAIVNQDYSKYEELDWLSLMQHNGMPTTLLDWSDNVLNALFFALYNEHSITGLPTISLYPYGQIYGKEHFINDYKSDRIVLLAPELTHNRAIAQGSLFTYHPDSEPKLSPKNTATIIINPIIIAEFKTFLNHSGTHIFKVYRDLPNLANWLKDQKNNQLPLAGSVSLRQPKFK